MRSDLPHPDESLLGFLCRVADLNAYPSAASFLVGSGLQYGRTLIERIDELERLLSLPQCSLDAISPSVTPPTPALEWRFERARRAPVCPLCISEGRPHQQLWRHALASACPHHEIRLVDRCSRCGSDLKPSEASFRGCSCGFAYGDFTCEPAEPEEVAISALIAGGDGRCQLPAHGPFCGTAPRDVASFLFFLASNTRGARTGKDGKAPIPATVSDTSEFLRDAGGFITQWPERFDEHVRDRLAHAPPSNSAPEMLGRWYQRLMRFRDAGYDPFRDRVAAVVAAEFSGAYGVRQSDPEASSHWVSLAEAARILEIRPERVREERALELLGAQRHTSGFGHVHFVCRRGRVEELARERREYVDRRTAREMLGISRVQMHLVEEAGLIAEMSPQNRPLLANGGFRIDAIEALISEIAGRSAEADNATVEFREINLRRATDRNAIICILQAIREGVIAPVTATGKLGDFRFAEGDLASVRTNISADEGYTAREVARMTGWKEQCIAKWRRAGLLGTNPHQGGVSSGTLISPASLATFQSSYIPVSELAKQLGTSAKNLLSAFADRGILTIGDFPDGPVRRGHLVRIADLVVAGRA